MKKSCFFGIPTPEQPFEKFPVRLRRQFDVNDDRVVVPGELVEAEFLPDGSIRLLLPHSETIVKTEAKRGYDFNLTCPVVKLVAMTGKQLSEVLEVHYGFNLERLVSALIEYQGQGLNVAVSTDPATLELIVAGVQDHHPSLLSYAIPLP